MFSDLDSDTLTYWATAEHPGVLEASVSSDFWLVIDAHNPSSTTVTYGVHDGYGGHASGAVTLTPRAIPTRSVAERSPAGTAVGDPVTGTPYDDGDDETDDALTYTMTGEAATSGLFVIDAASGQISVAEGASLDYETKSSYTGEVNWTVQDQAAVAELTIDITDVGAGKPGTPALTRTEFTEQTAPALDVTWTAAAANGFTITGYQAQYRVKVANGETENAWTDYTGTLGATATTFNLAGLDAGATYEAQVRAVTTEESTGPWSDTGEGTANTPPTATSAPFQGGTFPVGSTADYRETGAGALGVLFADGEGDALTYSPSAQHPALIRVTLSGTAGEAHLRATLLNPGASKIHYTASDPYGGSVTRTVTITGTAKESRSVAERSPAGTPVGVPVTGTPYNRDALTYTLKGKAADSGLFSFDSATGQISVAEGATLDYEAEDGLYRETETWNGQIIAKFYRGEVHYTVDGHAAVINVNINVTDVEATIPDAPTVTRTEFSEPTAPALDVSWASEANGLTITGYEVQYRIEAADGEEAAEWTTYTYTNTNGDASSVLPPTATSINLPDLEPGVTYEAQVRALTSEEAEGPWSDTGEGTANTPPTATSAPFQGGTFPVGSTADYRETGAGALGVLFADGEGDALTYSASAEHPALLGVSLSGAAGEAHLRADLLNPGTSKIHYTATDPYGGAVTRTVTITGTADVSRSVAERSPAGTAVGAPVTGTPYNGKALAYTLTGTAAAGAFVIDPATGQISVAEGATLDYETKDSYEDLSVEYTVDGHAASITVNIDVTDVEATIPDAPTVTRTEFSEPTAPALDVAWTAEANGLTITGYEVQYRKKAAESEEAAEWTTYTYTNTNGDASSVLPPAATSINLSDLEVGATYEAQVRALTSEEAEGPWSDTGEGTANRPPNLTSVFYAQDSHHWGGTKYFALGPVFQDADSDPLTYSATAEYPGLAKVQTDAGGFAIVVRNPGETAVTYGAHDSFGGYVSRVMPFTGVANEVRSVAENSPAGTLVGRAVQGTRYGGETLTHTLTGDATSAFEIDAATGQVSVADGATLDYDTQSSYTGTVEYTVDGQVAVINLTINVTALTVAIDLPETFNNLQPINVTFTFWADVTGFEASDITVENGTLGSLSGNGAVYTSKVTPNGGGDVTVTVKAKAVTTAAGKERPLTAASAVSHYLWVRLTGPAGPLLSEDPYEVVATFSDPPGDAINPRGLNIEKTVPMNIEGTTVTLTLTPKYHKDRWGTWAYQNQLWFTWRGITAYWEVYVDPDPPRVHQISGPKATQIGPFSIGIQMTEPTVGFSAEDLTVVKGKVTAMRQTNSRHFVADITPTHSGRLTVDIATGVFQDLVRWDNIAAQQYSVNVDLSKPTPTPAPHTGKSAAARARRANGDAVGERPHDYAGRGMDGARHHWRPAHNRLRRTVPDTRRNELDRPRFRRYEHSDHPYRPGGGHRLRSAGAGK